MTSCSALIRYEIRKNTKKSKIMYYTGTQTFDLALFNEACYLLEIFKINSPNKNAMKSLYLQLLSIKKIPHRLF